MNKTITIPVELLERVRDIPGADGITDSQAVILCLEAAVEHIKKEKALAALEALLEAQGAEFSDMVLEYAGALSSIGAAVRGYLHDTVMSAAKIPQNNIRPAWIFIRALSGKKAGA